VTPSTNQRLSIAQVFADHGAENPCLSNHGTVYRFSWKLTPNQYSHGVKCNAEALPIRDDYEFDVSFWHPPCGGASPMSDTGNGSRDDWDDYIPLAREKAPEISKHYIIENKPRDSLNPEVVLDGHMFNLGIEYERGFETSFPVEQPRKQNKLADTSPFFYTEWSPGEWASVKGSSTEFGHEHLAKNTIPAAYLNYLMRYYYRAVDDEERSDYSEYDKEMDARRAREENTQLGEW